MDEDLILLGIDYARIQSAWDAVLASGAEAQTVNELAQASHRLAGAALSIGYTDIGNAARNLETALRSTASSPDLPLWKNSLDTLAKACTDHKLDELYHKQMLENTQSASINQTPTSNTKIYLIDDDLTQAQLLAAQVSRFGYQVQVFNRLADLHDQLMNGIPKAVLMDIVFPEGELAGAEEIRSLQAEFNNQIPVFFISVRDDTAARIQAIRAGGIGYFTKPVDIDALMDEINKLNVQEDPQPYRVMIVDDSEVQAKASAMHLKKPVWKPVSYSDPLKYWASWKILDRT